MSWDFGAIGMFHKPLEGFHWPQIMIFHFLRYTHGIW